jgi:hypothetical protein
MDFIYTEGYMKRRAIFKFSWNILAITSMIIFIISCQSSNNSINPVLPGYNSISETDFNGNAYQGDNYQSSGIKNTVGTHVIITGPAEYLASKLNPPNLSTSRPEFSARIENSDSSNPVKNIKAKVDSRYVPVSISGDSVNFSPGEDLYVGEHRAELKFQDAKGYPRTFMWRFSIYKDPPEIDAAFTRADGSVMVFFERRVEPEYLKRHSNWSLNGNYNVLDENMPIINYDNMIVIVKLKSNALDSLINLRQAELAFSDNLGRVICTIASPEQKGIKVEKVQNQQFSSDQGALIRSAQSCDPVDCDDYCGEEEVATIRFCFCNEGDPCGSGIYCRHEPIENEDYAIVWELENQYECNVKLVYTKTYFSPVSNSDPTSVPFTQIEDLETLGQESITEGPWIKPLDKSIGTMKFPPNWKISVSWECQVTYCKEYPPGCAHLLTATIKSGQFLFESAADTTNPDFADLYGYNLTTIDHPNPEVLTGMELADYLDDIFTQIPMFDDPDYFTRGNAHCYSRERIVDLVGEDLGTPPDEWGNYESGILYQLRNTYCCNLFVFAAAEDKAPDPQFHKAIFTNPTIEISGTLNGQPFIDWLEPAHFDPGMAGEPGWEIDFKPWGAPTYYFYPHPGWPVDYEIFTEWDDYLKTYEVVDINDPDCSVPFVGCPWYIGPWLAQDYLQPELVLKWWNLSEILQTYEDCEDLDIRIFLEDEVVDPVMNNCPPYCSDHFYNWRKSENLMSQVDKCVFDDEESGTRTGQADKYTPCYKVKSMRFIDRNPHVDDTTWFLVNYSGDTVINWSQTETSMIYTRNNHGNVELNLFILLYYSGGLVYIPNEVVVEFTSTETTFPNSSYSNTKLAIAKHLPNVKTSPNDPIPGCPGLTGKKLQEFLNFENEACVDYYHVKLTVFDDVDEMDEHIESGQSYPSNPYLYVSSSDYNLDDTEKADFALSISNDFCSEYRVNYSNFYFGKKNIFGQPETRRGVGYQTPNITEDKWYSYDEFMTNGGMELVKANKVYFSIKGDDDKMTKGKSLVIMDNTRPTVPVQSEADLLLFIGHGGETPDTKVNTSVLRDLSHPEHIFYTSNDEEWAIQARNFTAAEIPDEKYFIGKENHIIWTDYKYYYPEEHNLEWQWWGNQNDKGNFWMKKTRKPDPDIFDDNIYKELRWLTAIACGNLSIRSPEKPALNYAKLIELGYFESMCGFKENVDIKHSNPLGTETNTWITKGTFAASYGEKLNQLFKDNGYHYDLRNQNLIDSSLYAANCQTNDLNVAAFMETAVKKCRKYSELMGARGWNIDEAAAIAYNYNQYCFWYLDEKTSAELEKRKNRKFGMIIRRKKLPGSDSFNPPDKL